MKACRLVCIVLFALTLFAPELRAQTIRAHHPEFVVPKGLRARVNFWKDIFTKYGQHQVLIHYRLFPQVVFSVLDFRPQAAELGPIALELLKEKEVKKAIVQVQDALKHLATGSRPANRLEEHIQGQMGFMPGGPEKYVKAAEDDGVRSQTGIRDKFVQALQRSGRYLPVIEKIFVRDFNLPLELTRLPFVESSFDYTAYSSVGAAGIWQFMPRTARLYMSVNNAVDERRDPIESSEAAAKFLWSAHNRIGTWPLTVTSYNHGVAGVIRKVREAGTTDMVALLESTDENKRAFGFASSNFFPSLLAAIEAYDDRHFLFPGVEPEPALRIAKVRLPHPQYVRTVSKQLECDLKDLKAVNYALTDRVWEGRMPMPSGYVLKVPGEYAARLDRLKFEPIPAEPTAISGGVHGGLVYKVKKGDTLRGIAKKFSTSTAELKALNGMTNEQVKAGQSVVIRLKEPPPQHAPLNTHPRSGRPVPEESKKIFVPLSKETTVRALNPAKPLKADEKKKTAFEDTSKKKGAAESIVKAGDLPQIVEPPSNQKPALTANSYRVKPGDTLHSLARKFGTSADKLKALNHLSSTNLHVGQVIETHAKK